MFQRMKKDRNTGLPVPPMRSPKFSVAGEDNVPLNRFVSEIVIIKVFDFLRLNTLVVCVFDVIFK